MKIETQSDLEIFISKMSMFNIEIPENLLIEFENKVFLEIVRTGWNPHRIKYNSLGNTVTLINAELNP